MGRPLGFKLSDEQRQRLVDGRKRAKEERIKSSLVAGTSTAISIPKKSKPKFVMSADQKAAMQEGRKKARAEKIAAGIPVRNSKKAKKGNRPTINSAGKPIVYITGREKIATDFYEPIRDAFRLARRHNETDRITREITDKDFWKNTNWIINKLSSYAEIQQI